VAPLGVALPAAAASLAYLNARWSVFYDVRLLGSLISATVRRVAAEKRGRLNLFYVLEGHALNPSTSDMPFVVFDHREWTFHQVYQTALRYGAWIKQTYGVKPGEVVAMDFMNSATFVFIWMGLWSIGAVPAFINYNLAKASLTHSVKASTSRLLFVDEEVRGSFPPDQLATFASPDFRESGGSVEVVFHDKELESRILRTEPVRQPDASRSGQEARGIAILIYTSGTTGLPKPAIVSWQKCYMGGDFVGRWLGLRKTDRVYTVGFPLLSALRLRRWS
jgi:acyl-CoA synthetase (AMP-forming)/AMP-acid ligase II